MRHAVLDDEARVDLLQEVIENEWLNACLEWVVEMTGWDVVPDFRRKAPGGRRI
ncbi:hypothetical protein ACWD4T_31240 [Streptomyces umbrinus]